MKIKLTAPLFVRTKRSRKLELLPVPMKNGFPSGTTSPYKSQWAEFLKPAGQRLPLQVEDVNRIQSYMRRHGTEALSEDGTTAFTIAGCELVECDPAVCGDVDDAEGETFAIA